MIEAVTFTRTQNTGRSGVLTGVVAHIGVSREPGDVITLGHGHIPRFTVLVVVKDVVHGGRGHVFDHHLTLTERCKVLEI